MQAVVPEGFLLHQFYSNVLMQTLIMEQDIKFWNIFWQYSKIGMHIRTLRM